MIFSFIAITIIYINGLVMGYAVAMLKKNRENGAIIKRKDAAAPTQQNIAVAIRPKTDKERGVEKIIKRNEGKGGTPLKDIL